jgi:hypothetical protein
MRTPPAKYVEWMRVPMARRASTPSSAPSSGTAPYPVWIAVQFVTVQPESSEANTVQVAPGPTRQLLDVGLNT